MSSTKKNIRSAAARLFRKIGYKATSMRTIAKEVGIQAASIYNHYKSKQELLEDLLIEIAQLFTKGMNEINQSSLSSEQKLERIIALHVRLTIEHTDAISLITGEWVHLEEMPRERFIQLRDEYEKQFLQIINKGKREGVFKKIDTKIILFSILSTLRWLYSWYSKNNTYNQIELEQQLTEVLINGIKTS